MNKSNCRSDALFFGFLKQVVRAMVLPVWIFLSATAGQAAIYSWSGGSASDANWSDSANWGFAGTPANGDTVIFPASQPRQVNTNDISGLTLNQVRFVGPGGGYVISGDAFTLTNSIEATNTVSSNTVNNAITFANQDIIVDVSNGVSLNLGGALSGSVGMIKNGTGMLVLEGTLSDTYGGQTTVNAGVVELEKNGSPAAIAIPGTLIIGNGISGATVQEVFGNQMGDAANITVNLTSIFDLNNNSDTMGGSLTLNDGTVKIGTGNMTLTPPVTISSDGTSSITGAGTVQLGAGPCTINSIENLTIIPSLQGTAAITKTGGGNVFFTGANTYSGLTTVAVGYLWAENNLALGATSSGTVVSNGATLVVSGGVSITNESLTLNGVGDGSDWGALDAEDGGSNTNLWTGSITVNVNSTIMPYELGVELRLTGPIGGVGGVIVGSGGSVGLLTYEGASPNNYLGTTTVSSGALELEKTTFDGAVPGTLVIGDNVSPANSAVVRLLLGNQIGNNSTVDINSSGLLDENGSIDGFGGFNGTGSVIASGALLDFYGSGSYEFDGTITGVAQVDLDGVGATNVWTGTNTYTGPTIVNSGTFKVDGPQPNSPVTVSTNATLGGSGLVNTIAALGTISPGNSPGILNSSNVAFSSLGHFIAELTGPTPGIGGYDQLNVTGTVALGNAALTVIPAFVNPVGVGQQLIIINNDGADAVSGTFNGLPEGATINAGSYSFRISYVGGTGNDVALTVLTVPGAVAGSSVVGGNGGTTLVPDGCNNIYLVVTNTSSIPMLGVSAALASTDPSVVVTQPNSPYPNIPVGGKGTNLVPFQVSTLGSFACGSNATLELNVSDTGPGAFAAPVTLTSGTVSPVPDRFDNTGNLAIPDVGMIDSTNTVSGFDGPIAKVTVSMFVTHTFDSDLAFELIAPDNTTILLTTNTGSGGVNFGANCSPDSSRTTFDDSAATLITAGTAPFVGTFRPLGSLSGLIGKSGAAVNGNWRLRIFDCCGGSLGTLRCWSLFLSPVICAPGGGACALCPSDFTITNTIAASSAFQTGRLSRDCIVPVCGSVKPCPGPFDSFLRNYEEYSFYNGASNACITVTLTCTNCALMSAAYLGSFNPTDLCANYLGDGGDDTLDANGCGSGIGPRSYSIDVPSNSVFVVTVNQVDNSALCGDPYVLSVTGGACAPILNIANVGSSNVDVSWPTVAGGYNLESTPALLPGPNLWKGVTNVPVAVTNYFNVTNSTLGTTNRFYRLHGP